MLKKKRPSLFRHLTCIYNKRNKKAKPITEEDLSDITHLVQHPDLCKAFRSFLKSQYAEELLQFYLENEKFEKLDMHSNADIEKEANHIWEEYFTRGATTELNLIENIKVDVDSAMRSRRFSTRMFRTVKSEILYSLQYDMLPRFKDSENLKLLLKRQNK